MCENLKELYLEAITLSTEIILTTLQITKTATSWQPQQSSICQVCLVGHAGKHKTGAFITLLKTVGIQLGKIRSVQFSKS